MAVASAPARVSERFVAWVWQRQRLRGPLVCTDGRVAQVVFPGRPWGEGQPDFQGALIAWPNGKLEHGDVEIHVEPRAWWQHGHHADPAYREVILHVVLAQGADTRTLNVWGDPVATLPLEPYLDRPLDELLAEHESTDDTASPPCLADAGALVEMLETAGVRRFMDKADRLEGDLAVTAPGQLLWRGVARALGYTRNAAAMTRLAEHCTLADTRLVVAGLLPEDAVQVTFGALCGAAGLLPSQRGERPLGLFAEALEAAWLGAREHGWSVMPGVEVWETCRVRPANHPVRRLAGLAVLAERLRGEEPLAELARLVLTRAPAAELVRRFTVTAPAREWGGVLDIARPLEPAMAGLVGRDRAVEIVINAVLPLLHALARAWGNAALEAATLDTYRAFPGGSGSGLARHMAEQILGREGPRLARTACRQQGLLHIYRTSCHAHACGRCPAGGAQPPV